VRDWSAALWYVIMCKPWLEAQRSRTESAKDGFGVARVFLDVGAHVGESLKPALDRRYRFDTIVCFEPVRECWAALEELADDRVEICRFGLGKESSPRTIYGAGLLGASIFPEAAVSGRSEVVQLQRASDWFMEHIRDGDEVYLKLNCEGSECDILEDLLESGEIRQVKSALVDFDVRKVPLLAHREREVTTMLDSAGHSSLLCLKEDHKGPSHTVTIENWLKYAGVNAPPPSARWLWRYVWLPRVTRRVTSSGKGLMKRLLPERMYERVRSVIQRIVYDYPSHPDS
jgi:FkbM family methyltransferase